MKSKYLFLQFYAIFAAVSCLFTVTAAAEALLVDDDPLPEINELDRKLRALRRQILMQNLLEQRHRILTTTKRKGSKVWEMANAFSCFSRTAAIDGCCASLTN
jgi:hypothetical protein